MRPGDTVIYLADRTLYGPGRYLEPAEHGLMLIEFPDGTRERFRPHELDTPDRAYLTPEAA